MAVRAARLPGIRFEVQPPALAQFLPRMDIGVFVGFAASGPLNIPVAVEDPAHFEAVFGGDLELAWDEQRGEMETAYLAPTVRAFFRNGGRRCFIIRVAGPARTNIFPLPGLLRERKDGQLTPAYAQARSEGSWSDTLQASWDLLSQPLGLVSLGLGEGTPAPFQADLALAKPGDLLAGDLLLISFQQNGESYQLMFTPDRITPAASSGAGAAKCRVSWSGGRWFRLPGLPLGGASGTARTRVFNSPALQKSRLPCPGAWIPDPGSWKAGRPVELALDLPPEQAPETGSLIQANFGSERLWLVVLSAQIKQDDILKKTILEITGSGLWESPAPQGWLEQASGLTVTRLRLGLAAQKENEAAGSRISLSELGFFPGQARCWSSLPGDQALYTADPADLRNPYLKLWQAAAEPRFPLAGLYGPEYACYPLPLPAAISLAAGPIRRPGTALERDGLGQFSLDQFLDPLLQDSGVETLLGQADFLTYEIPVPHQLKGIYAALRLEEATLIAAPDVLHTGWIRDDETRPDPPQAVDPPAPQMECQPPLPEDSKGWFSDLNALGSPVLTISEPGDPASPYRVSWTPASGPVAIYRLQEATLADFSDAVTLFSANRLFFDLAEHGPGAYFYRVRAEGAQDASPGLIGRWSQGLGLRIGLIRRWKTIPPAGLNEDRLAKFQAALLTLCAARGDLFAVLGLPVAYHEDDALRYAGRLQFRSDEIAPGILSARTLSFGALYHSWLYLADNDQTSPVRRIPPEGAVCGIFARRALARGAWLAPANEPLAGVVALDPRLSPNRYLELQEGSLNLVRQERRSFITLSEQTLTLDEDYRPVHIRRLMSLLRRLALREGATYVFEPNSPAFRRQVQRGLEEILEDLFSRGAFGGATPETSFQVDVSDRLNPPASLEQGRLVVEIRVAPAQALMFLTIRLVQTGAREFQVQEGSS